MNSVLLMHLEIFKFFPLSLLSSQQSILSSQFLPQRETVWCDKHLPCDPTLCAQDMVLAPSCPSPLSPADWKAEKASLVVDVHVSNVYMTAAGCFVPKHPALQTSRNSGFAVVLMVYVKQRTPNQLLCLSARSLLLLCGSFPAQQTPSRAHHRALLLWSLPHQPPAAPHHGPVQAAAAGLPSTPHLQA